MSCLDGTVCRCAQAWEGVDLELMDYRETKTYIMKGSEDMIQLLEDQVQPTTQWLQI